MFRRPSANNGNDFRKDIPEYSDERIIQILKQRDHYLPEAAKLAVEEAIKRGIIYSEQDLFADEYKPEELNISFFPRIYKAGNKNKIRKSLARSFVIYGVMPLVFGLVEMNKGKEIEGSLIVLFGMLWIFMSGQLIKAYKKKYLLSLLGFSILAAVYVYAKLILAKSVIFFDFFLPGVLFLLMVYALLFLKRIGETE